MTEFETHICRPTERRAALELIYSHLSPVQREHQIKQLLNDNPKLLEGLLICLPKGSETTAASGAMLCLASAGRTIMVWPPAVSTDLDLESQLRVCSSLMLAMRRYALFQRARLVQTLLSDEEKAYDPIFRGIGFFYLTRLLYLQRVLANAPLPPLATDLEFVSYREDLHADLLEILRRSYEASLDCPELNGVRELQDIFESHRAQGEFDPANWLLARHDGRWVGCLLMVGLPELQAMEVAYVSVLPEMRGRGLGKQLTRKALHVAQACGAKEVTLAVDERNVAARRVYDGEGFVPWDNRHAYLLILDPADGNFKRQRNE